MTYRLSNKHIIRIFVKYCFILTEKAKKILPPSSKMSAYFTCIMITAMLSLASGEKCGPYVRGPLAATSDTVIINLDCNQSTSSSRYVPMRLPGNATHVAVQLIHCPTVPVGMFTNVTDNLMSVTLASEDAIHLLEGTFEGLAQVRELRLLGFNSLKNLSRSVLEPLRHIETLILDSFGSANIELSYLGSVIRKLSGTPIRRLVLNKIKDHLYFQQIMEVDNFAISNASLKEVIIADVPFNYKGSIRRAFPELVCFCAGGNIDEQTLETFPALLDLVFLSKKLKQLVLYVPKDLPALQAGKNSLTIPVKQLIPSVGVREILRIYPDLVRYFFSRRVNENCALDKIISLGDNLSAIYFNNVLFSSKTEKPFCIEADNSLVYLDLTGSHIPAAVPEVIGLKKLKYFSLENTGIGKLPRTFLQHYPSLEVIKLGKLNLGDFVKNADEHVFGSCPTLSDIYLDDCNITNIATIIFSRSINLRHLDLSKNSLRAFDFDLLNCTKLNLLNFSGNNIGSIPENRTSHLAQLASLKTGGNKLVVDLTDNELHCLCNSTNFVKWLQRLPTNSNIKFQGFNHYTCLYPNGSIVPVSSVTVSESALSFKLW